MATEAIYKRGCNIDEVLYFFPSLRDLASSSDRLSLLLWRMPLISELEVKHPPPPAHIPICSVLIRGTQDGGTGTQSSGQSRGRKSAAHLRHPHASLLRSHRQHNDNLRGE